MVDGPINVCENVADHIFIQNIEDCSKYFVCVDGQAIAQQCRSGLYFDASHQACVASRSACFQCPKERIINAPLLKTCDKYVTCYYGTAYLRRCENRKQFNRKTGKCDLAKNVDCVDNRCSIHILDSNLTYVASAAKCENYYVCIAGQPKPLTCAQDLYFSTKCNCCDIADNVDCLIDDDSFTFQTNVEEKGIFKNNLGRLLHLPKLINDSVNIKCPLTGSFMYPNYGNPEYYYTCVNGKASLMSCADGYQFNNSLKRCVGQEQQEDNLFTNFEDNDLVTEAVLFETKCPEFGAVNIPHPQSKEKYILCVNGNATEFDCPTDYYFNTTDNACRSYYTEDEVVPAIICPKFVTLTLPHVDKNKFYLCLDGKAFVFDCEVGQYFDPTVQSCRVKEDEIPTLEEDISSSIANNSFIKCSFTKFGTFMFPHAQKNRYYVCINGNAIAFACAEGHIFDSQLNTCTASPLPEIEEIQTPTILDEPANILCPSLGTSKFPHEQTNKFYLCINGMASVLACANGTIFDAEIDDCRRTFEQEDSITNELSEKTNDSSINCPKIGTFVYPHENENQYYVCLDGKLLSLTCNEGLYFDSKDKTCRIPTQSSTENVITLETTEYDSTEITTITDR